MVTKKEIEKLSKEQYPPQRTFWPLTSGQIQWQQNETQFYRTGFYIHSFSKSRKKKEHNIFFFFICPPDAPTLAGRGYPTLQESCEQ